MLLVTTSKRRPQKPALLRMLSFQRWSQNKCSFGSERMCTNRHTGVLSVFTAAAPRSMPSLSCYMHSCDSIMELKRLHTCFSNTKQNQWKALAYKCKIKYISEKMWSCSCHTGIPQNKMAPTCKTLDPDVNLYNKQTKKKPNLVHYKSRILSWNSPKVWFS